MKHRKLKFGIACTTVVVAGIGIPAFAVHWQKMKVGPLLSAISLQKHTGFCRAKHNLGIACAQKVVACRQQDRPAAPRQTWLSSFCRPAKALVDSKIRLLVAGAFMLKVVLSPLTSLLQVERQLGTCLASPTSCCAATSRPSRSSGFSRAGIAIAADILVI